MRGVGAAWWIARGWAIELFVGKPVREHSDLEIGCFRSKSPRPKDAVDFNAAWPLLNSDFQAWLARAIQLAASSCA